MVEIGITRSRKGFMQSVESDPLRKREKFAISLRKKKKDEIIKQKRDKLRNPQQAHLQSGDSDSDENDQFNFRKEYGQSCTEYLQTFAPELFQTWQQKVIGNQMNKTDQQVSVQELAVDIVNELNKQHLLFEQLVLTVFLRKVLCKLDEEISLIKICEQSGIRAFLLQIINPNQTYDSEADKKYLIEMTREAVTILSMFLAIDSIENHLVWKLEFIGVDTSSDENSWGIQVQKSVIVNFIIKSLQPGTNIEYVMWLLNSLIYDNVLLAKMICNNTNILNAVKSINLEINKQAITDIIVFCRNIITQVDLTQEQFTVLLFISNSMLHIKLPNALRQLMEVFKELSQTLDETRIQLIASSQSTITQILSFLSKHIDQIKIIEFTVQFICNLLASANTEVVKLLCQGGVLDKLHVVILTHETQDKAQLHETILWGLSNIACDKEFLIEQLICNDIFKWVIKTSACEQSPLKVRKETITTISNVVIVGTIRQKREILELYPQEIATAIHFGLSSLQGEQLFSTLEAIEAYFKSEQDIELAEEDSFRYLLENADDNGLFTLEQIMNQCPNADIQEKAQEIVETYIDDQEDNTYATEQIFNEFII